MKKITKVLSIVGAILFSATLFSCATTQQKAATVEETDRMFWTISGTDSKGNPSTVYILGTIHVGDERLYPLPDNISAALLSADRIAGEISSKDMQVLSAKTEKLMNESLKNASAAGRNVKDYLTAEQWAVVYSIFGEGADIMALYEPWVMTSTVSMLEYAQSGLLPDYGIDNNLMAMFLNEGKSWDGLDELQTQLDVITFGNYDQQLYMLKENLNAIIDPTETNTYINKLYNAYLTGNSQVVAEIFKDSETCNDPEMQSFVDSYNNLVMAKRNSDWAPKIKKYLSRGGTTFIFAGCGHFSGDDSVFKYLKQIGAIE